MLYSHGEQKDFAACFVARSRLSPALRAASVSQSKPHSPDIAYKFCKRSLARKYRFLRGLPVILQKSHAGSLVVRMKREAGSDRSSGDGNAEIAGEHLKPVCVLRCVWPRPCGPWAGESCWGLQLNSHAYFVLLGLT